MYILNFCLCVFLISKMKNANKELQKQTKPINGNKLTESFTVKH